MIARTLKLEEVARRPGWIASHWLPITLGVLVFSVIAVVRYDRRPPMILTSPVVTGDPIAPGHSVSVGWTQDWRRGCAATVSRVIEGGRGELAAIRSFDITPPGVMGIRNQEARVYVPKGIGSGIATLKSTIRFHCNWIQELWPITVYAPPVEIRVVEATPPN